MLFAVGIIALFAFLMCFALLRKVFCVIAQSVLHYCAKCYAFLRKLFCVIAQIVLRYCAIFFSDIAQIVLRYCAKCIKNAKNANNTIMKSFALLCYMHLA